MLPFSIQLQPGKPVFDQMIEAFHRALARGDLRDGDAFPSVRAMSRDLKISPTTAHKVVAHLKDRGFLISQPGVGMLVTAPDLPEKTERLDLLDTDLKRLIKQARDLQIDPHDLTTRIEELWHGTHQEPTDS